MTTPGTTARKRTSALHYTRRSHASFASGSRALGGSRNSSGRGREGESRMGWLEDVRAIAERQRKREEREPWRGKRSWQPPANEPTAKEQGRGITEK